MDNETRGELIEQVAAFRMVDEMVKTVGWQKFILPRFNKLREAHLQTLMDATELVEVFRAQERIKAIDWLIEDINLCISEGKEASEQLANEKEK